MSAASEASEAKDGGPVLSLRGVGFDYGALAVIDGLDLEVARGELVVCVGPSGCGKSTLLALLGGHLQPTRGTAQPRGPRRPSVSEPPPGHSRTIEVIDLAAKTARVIVPDFQLSLAIGREGQNARLAARLTGWRIDIRPDTEVVAGGPGATVPGQPDAASAGT